MFFIGHSISKTSAPRLGQILSNLLSKSEDLFHQKKMYKIRASLVWHEHIHLHQGQLCFIMKHKVYIN